MAFQNPRFEQRGRLPERDTSLYLPAVWAYDLPPQLALAAGYAWGLNQGYRFWPLVFEHDFELAGYTLAIYAMGLCTAARLEFCLYHVDWYGGGGTPPRLAIVAGSPSERITFTTAPRMAVAQLTVPKTIPRGHYYMACWLDADGKGMPSLYTVTPIAGSTVGSLGRVSTTTMNPVDWPGTLYWNEHTDPDTVITVAGVLSQGGLQTMERL